MDREKLLRVAREAGIDKRFLGYEFVVSSYQLARFAELVRADERADCLKLADEHEARLRKAAEAAVHVNQHFAFTARADSVATVADNIRNRGTPKETK